MKSRYGWNLERNNDYKTDLCAGCINQLMNLESKHALMKKKCDITKKANNAFRVERLLNMQFLQTDQEENQFRQMKHTDSISK